MIAHCIAGALFPFEEYLYNKYELSPYQLVGLEGVWGCTILSIIIIPIVSFIKCDAGSDYFCVIDRN